MNDPAQKSTKCGAKTRSGVPCAKFPVEANADAGYPAALVQAPKCPQAEPLSQP